MGKIVLASGSPRRQELLGRMGIRDFVVSVPQMEEVCPEGLSPEETVCRISRQKSGAVSAREDDIVITADTMVFLDEARLGKPADEAEALRMLTALQGRHHTVCTGVTVPWSRSRLPPAPSHPVPSRTIAEAAPPAAPSAGRCGRRRGWCSPCGIR